MKTILRQIKKGYVKINAPEEWNNFSHLSFLQLSALYAIYIDNSKNKFHVDYEFLHRIASLTKYNGWCELSIYDPLGLKSFRFLQQISVDQLFLSSKYLNLDGISNAGDISVLLLQTNQKLKDLSALSSHKEICTLDIHCKEFGSIRPLNRLKRLSVLGLHGSLTSCDELCCLNCFKKSQTTDLFLDGNLIQDIDALTHIYAPIINLDFNCISNLHPLIDIINHNLKDTYGFEISMRKNHIPIAERKIAAREINNLPESQGEFPKLTVSF